MKEPFEQKPENSIYLSDTVYRPIFERDSALLEVETGCSYGRCKFCDFIRDDFQLLPMEQIHKNIQILGQREPERTALFLLGQNALCRKTEDLLEIFNWAKLYMPKVERINMYGRVDDIIRKGNGELSRLRQAGLGILHVGIESGSSIVLEKMAKGVTPEETLKALKMLEQIGIYYHITYILGLGGQQNWRNHVEDTIKLFNQITPLSIWALNLKVWPDTPLAKEVEEGKFLPLLPEQMLFEEKLILEQLALDDCIYMDTTALNTYTLFGQLQKDREKLLQGIDTMLKPFDLYDFLMT